MRDKFSSLLLTYSLILLVLPASYTSVAHAQSLYQVELMVFAYPGEGASEQWEALPELAYPDPSRLLIDPADQRAAAAQPGTRRRRSHPPMRVTRRGLSSRLPPLCCYQRLRGNWAPLLHPCAPVGAIACCFMKRGSSRYPGNPRRCRLCWTALQRGEVWPELQGTIALYQAGEFILETNLWRNTGGEYLPGTWRMPAPPRGPGPGAMGGTQEQREAIPAAQGIVGQIGDAGADNYPYRHAVLLQQTRRMRPGQVYYIDHPLLGLAVKITSLEAPAKRASWHGRNPATNRACALDRPAADQFAQQ
jgi:hypothetical protein